MEEEKILENITKSITERLKVPIILTYVCVLIIHNWDILFFLFFDSSPASNKVQYIRNTYGEFYYARIFNCLLIAVILIVLFTVLNTTINFCLKWFYRKDKEITSEIESFEKIDVLTEQLSKSIENIKKLNAQIENLKTVNANLNSKNLNVGVTEISEKDYEDLLTFLNTKENKEKLLYSLKELIGKLKKDPKSHASIIYKTATYEKEMAELITYLVNRNHLKTTRYRASNDIAYDGFALGTSFKDFLKREV